jgi:SAM-dependent methyltransferase
MANQSNSSRVPTPISDIYSDGTYLARNQTWHLEDSGWKAEQISQILAKHRIKAATIAEVGCGAGGIIAALSARMPETKFVGYEVSPQAFELCQDKASKTVSFRLENIGDSSALFDCLLCIDVFEHVEDYIGFLRMLRGKATHKVFHIPLDLSALSVLRSWIINARNDLGHLHYFTRESALATLNDAGYAIVDSYYTRPFDGLPSKTWKERVLKPARKLAMAMSPELMVRLLGGCSYLF